MPTVGELTRKVLNLPETEQKTADPSAPTRSWQEAAQRLKETDAEQPQAAPADRRPSWSVQEERSGARFARRCGRGLLWLVVALAALTGVREWVYPDTQTPPARAAPDKQAAYPTEDAQAVTARWTRAYLTWDEDDPELREDLLAADMSEGADTSAGWDGDGHQEVLSVQPGQVTVTHEGRARVHVTALVAASPEKDGKKETEAQPHWTALEVPVTAVRGRVVVTGPPGLVGMPKSGPQTTGPEPESDTELGSRTRGVVDRFFAEYAAGDIKAELAPGAMAPALPPGMELETVQSWTAHAGDGDHRTGTAVVVWNVAGAQLTQTYRVELTRVSANSGQRWQVSDILGGAA